jgi:hypothetical protein
MEGSGVHWLKATARTGATLLLACALVASGCAGMNLDARQILQQPASCDSAQTDIVALEASRAGGGWRFAQGLQGLLPPMIILSLLRDAFIGKPYRSIYLDHWRVAFGSYNEQIDARVTELQNCGA